MRQLGGADSSVDLVTVTSSLAGYSGLVDPGNRIVQGTITAFADYSGTVAGTVKVTCVGHGLTTGWPVTISGTTSYNGVYSGVTTIDADNFYVTATWVADDAAGTFKVFRFDSATNRFYFGVTASWAVTTSGATSALEDCPRVRVPLLDVNGAIGTAVSEWETTVDFVVHAAGAAGTDVVVGMAVGDVDGADFAGVVSRRAATTITMEMWATNGTADIGTPTSLGSLSAVVRRFKAFLYGWTTSIYRYAGTSWATGGTQNSIDYSPNTTPTLVGGESLYAYVFAGRRDAADVTATLVVVEAFYRPLIAYTPPVW
jgi:hypothetical protein